MNYGYLHVFTITDTMTFMNIYLARHGQNQDNANGVLNGHRDLPLTDLGRSQAQELANLIVQHNMSFDHILSSPLQRAFETAGVISHTLGRPSVEIYDQLIERDFGVMSGVKQSRIKELCAPNIIETDTITYFLSPEGAETFDDLIIRARDIIDHISARYHDKENILLVGHGDMGKMIYAAYYDLPWRDVLVNFHFGNSELLLLSPDSGPDETHVFAIKQHNH